MTFHLFFDKAKQIVVITACKTSVTRDYDKTPVIILRFLRVDGHHIDIFSCDLSQCALKCLKIWTAVLSTLHCLVKP